jgi:hypothetical protein
MRFGQPWKWFSTAVAGAIGLALRLFFVLRFPAPSSDGPLYEALATNWRVHGIYGLNLGGRVAPVDIRVPGYPAFLAAVSYLLGRGDARVMLAQVVVDLGACALAAILAGMLAPERSRGRVQIAAFWLAALCPFLANYTATVLTEALATFLTAAALIVYANGCAGNDNLSLASLGLATGTQSPDAPRGSLSFLRNSWFLGGLAVGLGTLVRPETPLLLIAVFILLLWRWKGGDGWPKVFRAAILTGVGFVIPLAPWVIRNAVSLHEFQPLAPRYTTLPNEVAPRGYYAWTNTWLTRYNQINPFIWPLEDGPLNFGDFPSAAFDTPDERARVAALIAQYDDNCCDITTAWDAQFGELARERTARHPLRTYLTVPFARAITLWFTPRVELLPYSGYLWPPRKRYREDRPDFRASLLLFALGIVYVGLALAGAVRIFARRREFGAAQLWPAALLVLFCILRTAYLTRIETPEPRYVLECFPAVFALAARLWAKAEAAV